jgi:hypothetical protein
MIYKDSSGVVMPITIKSDGGSPIDLSGATVDLVLVDAASTRTTKTATITDTSGGKCSYTLVALDLPVSGTYKIQAVVKYGDGREFPATPISFEVLDRV